MLIEVKCKLCNNHYPLRDIQEHTVQCGKATHTEMVRTYDEHKNIFMLFYMQDTSENPKDKEVIYIGIYIKLLFLGPK